MFGQKLELMIEESAELSSSPGNFESRIKNGRVHLPTSVYSLFTQIDLYTVEQIIAFYLSYPLDLQDFTINHLGWNIEQAKMAYETFFNLVEPHIDQNAFETKEPLVYLLNALPPNADYEGKTPQQLEN